MRAFNLVLFGLILIAVVIVVYLASSGGIALGGYGSPSQPVKIQPPQPNIP